MIYILNKTINDSQVEDAIKICKSDSGIIGTKLRKAHEFLGETIAKTYNTFFSKESICIVFMRAALPFAYGFLNILDYPTLFYYEKLGIDFFEKNRNLLSNKKVIFIDAVINSGNGMLKAIKESNISKENISIVTNVLCEKAREKLNEYNLFTTRESKNSFKGEKVKKQENEVGPDTGDRLFKTM